MTFVIQTERIGNHEISIEQDKFNFGYAVKEVELFDESRGVERNRNDYETLKQAKKRFAYLKRKYRKERSADMGFYYVYAEDDRFVGRYEDLDDAIKIAESKPYACWIWNSYEDKTVWSNL